MKKLLLGTLCLLCTTTMMHNPAKADQHELTQTESLFDFTDTKRWLIRARAISIDPDEQSTVNNLNADVTAEDKITPELDFTYFFTDHVAAELILATAKHSMGANNGTDLGNVWILPPTLTAQYHFNPKGTFRPYVGAGMGYIFYYNEDNGSVNNVDYEDGESYALQAGMDYGIDKHWAVNFDVKKLYHSTNVSVNNGAITADVDLDPWVFGAGIAYKF